MAEQTDQPRCPYLRIDHQTLRAPVDGDPHGPNWVVRAEVNRRAVVVKIYEHGNPLCRHETIAVKNARRLARKRAAPRWIDVDPANLLVPGCRHQCLAMSHLPGLTLAAARTSRSAVVNRLLQAADLCWFPVRPRKTAIVACFPEATSGQFYWCALPLHLPVLSIRDHLLEALLLTQRQKRFDRCSLGAALIGRAHRLTWIDQLTFGFVHNDLHADNVLLANNRVAVVDFASACISNPFVDLGGILAHLGLVALDRLVYWAKDQGKLADLRRIQEALEFFCLKRSLRQLVSLSRSRQQNRPDRRAFEKSITNITALLAHQRP